MTGTTHVTYPADLVETIAGPVHDWLCRDDDSHPDRPCEPNDAHRAAARAALDALTAAGYTITARDPAAAPPETVTQWGVRNPLGYVRIRESESRAHLDAGHMNAGRVIPRYVVCCRTVTTIHTRWTEVAP